MADREEVTSSHKNKGLICLTGLGALFEILMDSCDLSNPAERDLYTKNPTSVAALGGVRMGLDEHPEPTYLFADSAATQERLV